MKDNRFIIGYEIGRGIANTFEEEVINGDANSIARYTGRTATGILLAVIGTKGIDKAAKTTSAGRTINKVDNVIPSGGTGKISTPYGDALQEFSDDALNVKNYIDKGGDLYRGGKFGRSNTNDAQFWAPESPYTPGYGDKYGVDFEDLDYIIGGKLKDGHPFITRPAPGLGNNTGGAIEVVTNPNAVKLDFFHMP